MVSVRGSTIAAAITATAFVTGAVKLGTLAITAGIAGTTLAAVGFAVAGVATVALAAWAIYLGATAPKDPRSATACGFARIFLSRPLITIGQLFKACCCNKKTNKLEDNPPNNADEYAYFSDSEEEINDAK